MYLQAHRYLGGWEHSSEDDKRSFQLAAKAAGILGFVTPDSPSVTVQATVGYWRKANQIHTWFVKHVQEGKDECLTHYVSRDQLKALREVCQTILDDRSKAGELLPPSSGFFFGSTDLDEWYWADITATVAVVDKCLSMPDHFEFHYRSSW